MRKKGGDVLLYQNFVPNMNIRNIDAGHEGRKEMFEQYY